METQNLQTEALAPSPQATQLAEQVNEGPMVSEAHEARLTRVLDYQASALTKEDHLEANLGSINSGLMRIGLWLDETIGRAMAGGPPTVERMHRILPAIETHLRVTRQVDRFAQIELRAAAARKPKATDDPAKLINTDAAPGLGITQSEDLEL
jgi:hypothetical protein